MKVPTLLLFVMIIVCLGVLGHMMNIEQAFVRPDPPPDPLVAEMQKNAEAIAWIGNNVDPVIKQLDQASDRLEKATDPQEKAALKLQIKQINDELTFLDKQYQRLYPKMPQLKK